MSELITAYTLYRQWREISSFRMQFICPIPDSYFKMESITLSDCLLFTILYKASAQ